MPGARWIYNHQAGFKTIWWKSEILMSHIGNSVFYPFSFPKHHTCIFKGWIPEAFVWGQWRDNWRQGLGAVMGQEGMGLLQVKEVECKEEFSPAI